MDPPPPDTEDMMVDARSFFGHISKKGWKVIDTYFDNHCSYPAAPGESCINSDICCFTRDTSTITKRQLFFHKVGMDCYYDEKEDRRNPELWMERECFFESFWMAKADVSSRLGAESSRRRVQDVQKELQHKAQMQHEQSA
jgi:hypothetical protein